jgi:hypothetical protein
MSATTSRGCWARGPRDETPGGRGRNEHLWRESPGLPPPESSGGSLRRGGRAKCLLLPCLLEYLPVPSARSFTFPKEECVRAMRPEDSGRGKPGGSRHVCPSWPLSPIPHDIAPPHIATQPAKPRTDIDLTESCQRRLELARPALAAATPRSGAQNVLLRTRFGAARQSGPSCPERDAHAARPKMQKRFGRNRTDGLAA